jgi:streptogrisin C
MGDVLSGRWLGVSSWRIVPLGLLALAGALMLPAYASAASIDLPTGASAAQVDAAEVSDYQDDFEVSKQTAEESLEAQEDGAGIVEALEDSQGEDYAGVWFDNESGEFVVPTVADANRASIAALLSASDLQGDFRTKPVSSSWDELEVAQKRINSALSALIEEGLVGTSLDPKTNAVVISQAKAANASQRAEIQAAARGESVEVEVRESQEDKLGISAQACQFSASVCDAPMRGGVNIVPSGGFRGTGCTAGFKGIGDALGNRFMLTAGHCVAESGALKWDSFTAGTEERKDLGHVDAYSFPTHDYAAINANGTYWDKPSWPREVTYWGVNQEYAINNESSSYIGEYVCHAGQQSGLSCGGVTGMNLTEPVEDATGKVLGYVNNMTRFEHICTIEGDSGGPVFTPGHVALGIYSSSDKPTGALNQCYWNGYYTEITEDTDLLGVHVAPRITPPPPPPPPAQPPIRAAFADAGDANSITAWELGSSGWQQVFLWGHPVAAGTKPLFLKFEETTHIFFVDASRGNQITEWSWNPTTGWQQAFIATDPVASGSSVTGAVVNGSPKLFFSDATTNRSITALSRSGSSWSQSKFYGDPVAVNSSPSAISNNGQAQVYFADSAKGNTIAVWTWGGTIQQSFFYGDPVAVNSSPSAISNNGQAQVYFADSAKGNSIAVWTWGTTIQQSFFYGDSVATNSSPSALSANGTPHVYFADGSKGNTIAVWVWTPSSLQPSFFGGDSVAANSSPSAALTSNGKDQVFFSDENANRSLSLWEWGSTLEQIRLYGHLALAGTSPGA